MEENNQNSHGTVPQDSASFGNVRNDSESFRTVPKTSEPFRNVRNDSEGFRSLPRGSERKENHTLTVREAARMFETAGVARTERSIVNWCQLNAQGVARLDAYFDPNERKYYIGPQSVERAIQEEIARAAKNNEPSEPFGKIPNKQERPSERKAAASEDEPERIMALEKEVLDLKILNGGKDFLIGQLRQERDGFINQLLEASHKVGALETRLLQLEGPSKNRESTAETSLN